MRIYYHEDKKLLVFEDGGSIEVSEEFLKNLKQQQGLKNVVATYTNTIENALKKDEKLPITKEEKRYIRYFFSYEL